MIYKKTKEEHKFTSTGVKFWKHTDKMYGYLGNNGNTIISTHISPEGRCNLNCSYCSVKQRTKHFRIELPVIKDYITKLCSRGLRAVIITGGGEPTLYEHFNEMVDWIKNDMGLSVALITNGTLADRVKVWDAFSWVRISLNMFKGWQDKIYVPKEKLNPDCVLGCSFIYVGQDLETFKAVHTFAEKLGSEYIRVLPDCLWDQAQLLKEHEKAKNILSSLESSLFFQQFKIHGTPQTEVCHQAFFRPYLSEVGGGTLYPCDSLVLNDKLEKFDEQYQICKAQDVLKFLDGEIKMKFRPSDLCDGCVFTDNVNMLDAWKNYKIIPDLYEGELNHVEFV